ncbi:MAG: GGDEF domain-containing protein [Ilumatobacteraceae bacterium]
MRNADRHAELDRLSDELARRAHHDALTGLVNRSGFHVTVDELLQQGGRSRLGLLFIDLDGFKAVNDLLGHDTGDVVLQEVGRRLSATVDQVGGIAARLGGDEFVVLHPEVADEADLDGLARTVRDVLDWPFAAVPRHIDFGASVGTAFVDADAARCEPNGLDRALRDADVAMYAAKRRRRGSRRANPSWGPPDVRTS